MSWYYLFGGFRDKDAAVRKGGEHTLGVLADQGCSGARHWQGQIHKREPPSASSYEGPGSTRAAKIRPRSELRGWIGRVAALCIEPMATAEPVVRWAAVQGCC